MDYQGEDFEARVDALCDGRATDEEVKELDHLLRTKPRARDAYLVYLDTHACLGEDCLLDPLDRPTLPPITAAPRRLPFALILGAVAALMLTLAVAVWWNPSPASVLPPFVAVVTNADGALWEGEDAAVMLGRGLAPGLLELCDGRVELEMDSGVQVALEGPARFELTGEGRAILHEGRMSASVPPEGIGFTVETPALSVVDLGTEFALNVSAGGESDVHVFRGEVEAILKPVGGAKTKQLLTSNNTGRVGKGDEELRSVPFDPARFPEPPGFRVGIERLWGSIRWLRYPPDSVRNGKFQHSFMLLFREQAQVELEDPLDVSVHQPGRYIIGFKGDQQKNFTRTLRVGVRVDSYLIHFDTEAEEDTVRKGGIRFERPIVAVIAGGEQLAATDELLGSLCTSYDRADFRDRQLESDEVIISADRLTLQVKWRVGSAADQLRVLVEADD